MKRSGSGWLFVAIVLASACDGPLTPPTTPSAVITSQEALAACKSTTTGLQPLNEAGLSPYAGVPLGLYPGGSNQMPAEHMAAGLDLASSITPLDTAGRPDFNGRYALISIGMSNTTQEFSVFVAMSPSPNLKLEIIDGAQGGQTAARWADPACPCWMELDARIQQEGLSRAQVVAAWVKLANAQPAGEWPAYASKLQSETEQTLRNLASRFSNLKLAYLSSRVYAGYATTNLNPEPYAYQGGFAVRGLIDQQLKGQLPYEGHSRVSPWIAWGPYLWADGMRARSDGLTWTCGDFEADGTHPSASGRQKVADQLLKFFQNDPTTREWFMAVHIAPPNKVRS